MPFALVMAGGSGTRFWPLSREALPKQLLNLLGPRSLLASTIDRLDGLVPRGDVIVATGARLVGAVQEQLPDFSPDAILAEPCKRDTAPCIGLVAMLVEKRAPEATMVVLPSDHVIRDGAAFQAAVRQAFALVEERPGRLVTFGIRPTYPAESFGYLERGEPVASMGAGADGPGKAYRVARFREKPSLDIAQQYVAAGNFFWNSGIFVWKARAILAELAARQPEMHALLEQIAASHGTPGFDAALAREFPAVRAISIDFAVMEHAADVVMIEAPFDWDDLGSWQALARQRGADEHGNTVVGRHLGVKTRGTTVYNADDGGGHLIVTVGVDDLIIVHAPDATLVASKRDEESLRQVAKLIAERGWRDHL
ncbi:MAG: mannose-1-phosphate guanylyltransferase [Planctomycetia bacterium]|nr:mannose-1-phosphate guanylyltransferase [Planctomycetia bacterium]